MADKKGLLEKWNDSKSLDKWVDSHPGAFGKIFWVIYTVFGICLIVGSIKNWDWLYAADGAYHNNWSLGQVSRYIGRNVARVIGFCIGVFVSVSGVILVYLAFFKDKS